MLELDIMDKKCTIGGVLMYLFALAWMSSTVLGKFNEDGLMYRNPPFVYNCTSENSFTRPDFPSVQHTATSNIHCAIVGHVRKAFAYEYINAVCPLKGEGLGETTITSSYHHGVAFTTTLQELAQNKPTYATIPFAYDHGNPYDSTKAVNSNPTDYYESKHVRSPWWVVDLEAINLIHNMTIRTRMDCCSSRLYDIEIRIGNTKLEGNFSSYKLLFKYPGPYNKKTDGMLICFRQEGAIGRYISIQRGSGGSIDDALQLADVKVYGFPVS